MPSTDQLFSDLYIHVRQKEGRLYSDNIVANLPSVPRSDPLRNEWKVRQASLQRLTDYLDQMPRPIRILELGCGNGWLSHHLARLQGATVWGMDRNPVELAQAARLFGRANLLFLNADIFQPPFPGAVFDVIVLASVIQYFPDLSTLVRELRRFLRARGELHILDSPFYETRDLEAARERTRAHYAGLGYPEMANYYFHHTYAELESFSPRWHYRADSLKARLSRALGIATSPFPWLSIC